MIIAAIAVVAVVAVGAVVFLLPNEKSAYDLLPDAGSFPDNWTGSKETTSTELSNVSSAATGTYTGPGSKMVVEIRVFDSVDAAEAYYTILREGNDTWYSSDSKYFANGFETTATPSGIFHFFQYKNVVGELNLQSGSLSNDPANDEWGSILSDIGGKINNAKKLV